MIEPFARALGVIALLTALAVTTGCSKKEGPPVGGTNTVRGKVTYKGQPVTYGFVLLFNMEKSVVGEGKAAVASSIGPIDKDGRYEVHGVHTGPMMICVATDPDMPPERLMAARGLETGGAALGGEDPLLIKGGPGSKGDGPGGPGGPPRPKDWPAGVPWPPPTADRMNPMLQDYSEAQKRVLREIHSKYGSFGKSPLLYPVREGEQDFDIELN